jgi:glycosyltransferase involved in cell wall biosynthesis
VPPTQRHRWLTLPDNREGRRRAELQAYAADQARADFEARHPDARFAPVVALIAAYEEEDNIGDVLKAMPTLVGDLEVSTLVVVDGGRDRTDRVAIDAGVFTCVLPVNLGQGVALRIGYRLAMAHGARYVVTLDADGQNDPTEMPTMVQPLLDGTADFVIASRRLGVDRTTDRFRRTGVVLYASLLNRITGQRLTDSSNGYRAFRIEVLEDIVPFLRQDQYQTSEVVITAASRGWRIGEQPTMWHPRASGTSKKGGNLVFGVQYARVIGTTWYRVSRAGQDGRLQSRNGSAAPQ